MNGISGIILNWKRPANVARIVAGWQAGGLVKEAIVWNNNPDSPFPRHDWAKVVNAKQDLGLYTRFAAACLAQHECVLVQDDDLELPLDSLRRLYDAWQQAPDILHGVFGRAPKPDGSYARDVHGDADVPIVLTRVLLAHVRYAAEFFQHRSAFSDIQIGSRPAGNGEDIIFNYVAMRASGRLNRVHRVGVVELPAPHAIHARPGHREHRTRLLRACESWLQEHRAATRDDKDHLDVVATLMTANERINRLEFERSCLQRIIDTYRTESRADSSSISLGASS